MADFKRLAWNYAGLRDSTILRSKAMYFEKTFNNDFDIAFFIETHHRSEEDIPQEILRYKNTHHILHSAVAKNETHAGIIGLLRKEYEIMNEKHLIQGRMLNIKIQHKIEKTKHNITAVYLDTNNHLTKDKIQNIVRKLRIENEDHSNNVVLGDFNFIDHEKDKRGGLNSTDKVVSKIWEPFLAETDMVDPFREQNPKKRIWSFIGTGAAGNSRIDRLYVNSVNMKNITNIQYIPTPFGGHRILRFIKKGQNTNGPGYYKLNTSILTDLKYKQIVEQTINELEEQGFENEIEKWETFILTIKSKSMTYSQKKNKVKKKLKQAIIKQIFQFEESPLEEKHEGDLAQYNYLQRRLREIEEIEIEGYIRRVKYMAPYEKSEPDIAFYSKLEQKKIANDTIGQLAENEHSEVYTDNENIIKIASKFYTDLYSPSKVN